MKRKKLNLWLARNNLPSLAKRYRYEYHLFNSKPCSEETWLGISWAVSHKAAYLYIFCDVYFERIAGIKLKPGECRKVKQIKIELEEA